MSSQEISSHGPGFLSVRGVPIQQLMHELSFVEVMILTITGESPKPCDPRTLILNVLFAAWVDHGSEPPSTQNVLNAASCNVPFLNAFMAGALCFGNSHAPIRGAADFLHSIVSLQGDGAELRKRVERAGIIPGFGHPVHKGDTPDPRVEPILQCFEALEDAPRRHVNALLAARTILHADGKRVSINLAGISAATWLDMGFAREIVELVPIIGRSVGLAAHFMKQLSEPRFRGTP